MQPPWRPRTHHSNCATSACSAHAGSCLLSLALQVVESPRVRPQISIVEWWWSLIHALSCRSARSTPRRNAPSLRDRFSTKGHKCRGRRNRACCRSFLLRAASMARIEYDVSCGDLVLTLICAHLYRNHSRKYVGFCCRYHLVLN